MLGCLQSRDGGLEGGYLRCGSTTPTNSLLIVRGGSHAEFCVCVCVCARAFSLVAPPDAKDGTPYLQVAIEKDSPDMVRLLAYQGARLAPVGEACFAAGAGP